MVTQLAELKGQRAPLALEIQKAAADKDVRENSPLEAAREQLGQVEARIREIESTLIKAVVIDASGKSKSLTVQRGTAVWVQDVKSGKKFKYRGRFCILNSIVFSIDQLFSKSSLNSLIFIF